jgi:hypothetical protein
MALGTSLVFDAAMVCFAYGLTVNKIHLSVVQFHVSRYKQQVRLI